MVGGRKVYPAGSPSPTIVVSPVRTGLTVSLTCVATTNTAVMAIVAVINRSAASWSIPRHDTGAEMRVGED